MSVQVHLLEDIANPLGMIATNTWVWNAFVFDLPELLFDAGGVRGVLRPPPVALPASCRLVLPTTLTWHRMIRH
jgi:hypothetical protein